MAGLSLWEMDDMTWGEILWVVEARREEQRRRAQEAAFIAYQQAGLIAQAALDGRLPDIYEVFPFWSEQEVRELRVEKYRAVMERYASKRVKSGE